MVDLFGLKKEPEPSGDPKSTPAAPAAPKGGKRRQKLWAFLLVVDSVFVIVFGGALAAKLYQHLIKAPPPRPPAATPARRGGKPAAPAKTAPGKAAPGGQPAAETAPAAPAASDKAALPAPAPAPAPSETKPAARASLAAQPQKHGKAPHQASAAKAEEPPAPARPEPGAKRRSVPVEFKIRPVHDARSVRLVGAFIVRGGRREMVRQEDGSFSLTIYLLPATSYRYWFVVDGKKTLDPENPSKERGASLLTLP